MTRTSYVASVEPICKQNKRASDRHLTGVSGLVRRDKLKKAGQNFASAATALEKTRRRLATVPQPPADAARLTRWLAGIGKQVALMMRISTHLGKDTKAGKAKASSLAVKLAHDANITNSQVIVFSFNYCRIDPSRYS